MNVATDVSGAGRRITASFLYNATRSLFEETGFSYSRSRPKGMNHCVMTATVAPAGHGKGF